jgi:hypothetical protein
VVVGLILGIGESQLRRALAISLADPMALLQSSDRSASRTIRYSKAASASPGFALPANARRRTGCGPSTFT